MSRGLDQVLQKKNIQMTIKTGKKKKKRILRQKVKRNFRLLVKVKVESEKVGLKLNIQKTEIMASGPITSWKIDG